MKINISPLINKVKSANKLHYLLCILFPVSILSSLKLLNYLHFTRVFQQFITYPAILFCALAAVSFSYYLRNTDCFTIHNQKWQLVLSLSYSLCSYGLVQESSSGYLMAFSLFPVLFLQFERMLAETKYIPFIIANALLLLITPQAGIPISLILFLLAIFELFIRRQLRLGNFLHVLSCFLFSFVIGAGRLFFYLAPIYGEYAEYAYGGFSMIYHPLFFCSRLLSGAPASTWYLETDGRMDIYFGMILLFFSLLFFFQQKQDRRKRFCYALFSLLLFLCLNCSSVQFAFQLFYTPIYVTIPFAFFFVFWSIRIAGFSLSTLKHTKRTECIIPLLLYILIIAVSWIYCGHNYSVFLAITHSILVISILIWCFIPNAKFSELILRALMIVEIILNAFIITNSDLLSINKSVQPVPVWEQTQTASQTRSTSESEAEAEVVTPQQQYQDFITKYDAQEDFSMVVFLNDLAEEVCEKDLSYKTANIFELCNLVTQKLGFEKPLFTKAPVTFSFEQAEHYQITKINDELFHIATQNDENGQSCYVPFHINFPENPSDAIFVTNTYDGAFIQIKPNQQNEDFTGYISFASHEYHQNNVSILAYTMDDSVYEQVKNYQTEYTKNEQTKNYYLVDYIGIGISYIAVMFLFFLLFYNDKEQVYQKFYQVKQNINHSNFAHKTGRVIFENRVYLLGFLIPFLFVWALLIVTNSEPFGSYSIMDEDGAALIVPGFFDVKNNAKNNNISYTLNQGFGNSLYTYNPFTILWTFLKYVPDTAIMPILCCILGICLGLSSVFMMYYLTHRLTGKQAKKNQLYLLIPGLAYSLSSYMLRMHSFTTWYFVLMVFPLLILAMERLIYQKKCLLYIVLLTLSISINIQLGLYNCVFLFLYFFTLQYKNIKDFFGKGIRFAITSLLSAGNSFFIISLTLRSSSNLMYNEYDSVHPTFKLYDSFLEEWKNYMLFVQAKAVSLNEGDLYAFCGILSILLVLIYFTTKKVKLSNKLRLFLPILFLSVSFNEQVLSYYWNGMHYQANVPNRYAYLLIFLLGTIVYDSLGIIHRLGKTKVALCCGGCITFFILCQIFSKGNSNLSIISTCVLLCIYTLVHCLCAKKNKKQYYQVLVCLFVVEILANAFYVGMKFNIQGTQMYADYSEIREFIEEDLDTDNKNERIAFPSNYSMNYGQVFDTPTINGFNSFISKNQVRCAAIYGYSYGANYITASYTSSEFGNDLAGVRYIFLKNTLTQPCPNLSNYRYLGRYLSYYVFENSNALSMGVYVPDAFEEFAKEPLTDLPKFYNEFANLFLEEEENIIDYSSISYSEDKNATNSFCFTDENGELIPFDQVDSLHHKLTEIDLYKLQIHINLTVDETGEYYVCPKEMVSIGTLTAGENNHISIIYPEDLAFTPTTLIFGKYNQTAYDNYIKEISKYQMQNIQRKGNIITGTITAPKDGYVSLNIADDPNWQAYIDGEPVDKFVPHRANINLRVTKGTHIITLKYVQQGQKTDLAVSALFILLSLLYCTVYYHIQKKKE